MREVLIEKDVFRNVVELIAELFSKHSAHIMNVPLEWEASNNSSVIRGSFGSW